MIKGIGTGSLVKDAWEQRYKEAGGTGSVALWAYEHAKTEWMRKEILKIFEIGTDCIKTGAGGIPNIPPDSNPLP